MKSSINKEDFVNKKGKFLLKRRDVSLWSQFTQRAIACGMERNRLYLDKITSPVGLLYEI